MPRRFQTCFSEGGIKTKTTAEHLLEVAENAGVTVFDMRLNNKSIAINHRCGYVIAYDSKKFDTAADLAVVLAHENGHYFKGAFYTEDTPELEVARCEYRANAWAYKAICPVERIKEAIKNNGENLWEIAEYLGLPEEFAAAAIEYYKGKGAF